MTDSQHNNRGPDPFYVRYFPWNSGQGSVGSSEAHITKEQFVQNDQNLTPLYRSRNWIAQKSKQLISSGKQMAKQYRANLGFSTSPPSSTSATNVPRSASRGMGGLGDHESHVDVAPSPALRPIKFDNFGQEVRHLTFPDVFDGFRLDFNQPLRNSLQLHNSLMLGGESGSTPFLCSLGPYFERNGGGNTMFARIGTDGSLSGRATATAGSLETKLQASSSVRDVLSLFNLRRRKRDEDLNTALELGLDTTGKDYTTTSRLVWQGAWILNGAFTQVLSPGLNVGAEVIWVSSTGASIGSMAAQYQRKHDTITAHISRQPNFKVPGGLTESMHSVRLTHARNISSRLCVGSEFETTLSNCPESSFKVGYSYEFKQARVTSCIDSQGLLSTSLIDKSGIGLSAVADILGNQHKIGLSLQLTPS